MKRTMISSSLALVLGLAGSGLAHAQANASDQVNERPVKSEEEAGKAAFLANCAACHQANGKGDGPIKPLDGAAVVLDADHAKQIQVLLHGQNNGAMPAWAQLSDTDIAAVVTYTKNNWSNKTGQLVQPSEVVALRGK